jgi:hypothetical protein
VRTREEEGGGRREEGGGRREGGWQGYLIGHALGLGSASGVAAEEALCDGVHATEEDATLRMGRNAKCTHRSR